MPLRPPSSRAVPVGDASAPAGDPADPAARPRPVPRVDDDARRQLDRVYAAAYEELRRLAASVGRGDRGATLSPTGLVHEAWLKLARSPEVARTSALHFRRIAARAMRQVLVDAARRRRAHKRGGRDALAVTFDEDAVPGREVEDLLGLDEALEELARLAPRQALLVEARFFAGLDMAELAGSLGISEATATREWRAARAWLGARLRSRA